MSEVTCFGWPIAITESIYLVANRRICMDVDKTNIVERRAAAIV